MLGPLYIQYPYFYKIHVHVHFEKVDMICTSSTLTCTGKPNVKKVTVLYGKCVLKKKNDHYQNA